MAVFNRFLQDKPKAERTWRQFKDPEIARERKTKGSRSLATALEQNLELPIGNTMFLPFFSLKFPKKMFIFSKFRFMHIFRGL